jgi:hypothetical protein
MTSPFRNHDGMSRRFARVGISRTYNPNSAADLKSLADEAVELVQAKGQPSADPVPA